MILTKNQQMIKKNPEKITQQALVSTQSGSETVEYIL